MSNAVETKQCTKCNEIKPLSEFNRHSQNKDGRHSHCRHCRQKYMQIYNATPKRRATKILQRAKDKRSQAEAKLGRPIIDNLKPYDIAMIQSADECVYCSKPLEPGEVTIDHVKSLKQGGANEYSNLLPCCKSCNSRKGDKPIYEFLNEHCDNDAIKQVIFTLAQRNRVSYEDMERQLKEEAMERARQYELSSARRARNDSII